MRSTSLTLVTIVLLGTLAGAGAAAPDGFGATDGVARTVAVQGDASAQVATEPGGNASATDAAAEDGNATASEMMPGEFLAGVVGAQAASVRGEVDRRQVDVRLSAAEGETATAAVVATELDASRERLGELRAERDRLETSLANGSITRGRYRAEMAQLAVRIATVQRVLDRTGEAAETVPADLLGNRGVDADAIRSLRTDAREMSGPEVAAAARGLADTESEDGPGIGRGNGFGVDVDGPGLVGESDGTGPNAAANTNANGEGERDVVPGAVRNASDGLGTLADETGIGDRMDGERPSDLGLDRSAGNSSRANGSDGGDSRSSDRPDGPSSSETNRSGGNDATSDGGGETESDGLL